MVWHDDVVRTYCLVQIILKLCLQTSGCGNYYFHYFIAQSSVKLFFNTLCVILILLITTEIHNLDNRWKFNSRYSTSQKLRREGWKRAMFYKLSNIPWNIRSTVQIDKKWFKAYRHEGTTKRIPKTNCSSNHYRSVYNFIISLKMFVSICSEVHSETGLPYDCFLVFYSTTLFQPLLSTRSWKQKFP